VTVVRREQARSHHRVILVDSTVWVDQLNDYVTANVVWLCDTIIGSVVSFSLRK
jgi:malonyl CoA-acyl carrier protein transacylase